MFGSPGLAGQAALVGSFTQCRIAVCLVYCVARQVQPPVLRQFRVGRCLFYGDVHGFLITILVYRNISVCWGREEEGKGREGNRWEGKEVKFC